MPFYTQILSQISPTSIYNVDGENIVLIPAGPFKKDDSFGGYTLFDAINFYTNSATKEDHISALRHFVIVYSFLFNDPLIYMFDTGELTNHIKISSYNDVPISHENGRDKVNFDDIAGPIYRLNKPSIKISLNEVIKLTKDDFINYFILYLDDLTHRGIIYYSPNYFIFNYSYLSIVNFMTILETIIGHPENCKEIISECKACSKKGIAHRKGSENDWIKEYLKTTIKNPELEESYFRIMSFARNIRHKTTHAGVLPTAKHILQDTHFEEYGFDSSKKEYEDNNKALLSILISIREITHYLMLNYFYGLNQFFPLQTLKSVRTGIN